MVFSLPLVDLARCNSTFFRFITPRIPVGFHWTPYAGKNNRDWQDSVFAKGNIRVAFSRLTVDSFATLLENLCFALSRPNPLAIFCTGYLHLADA